MDIAVDYDVKPRQKQTNRNCQAYNTLSSKDMCSVLSAQYIYNV